MVFFLKTNHSHNEWLNHLNTHEMCVKECADGYVANTTHGIRNFAECANDDHSVFIPDDYGICIPIFIGGLAHQSLTYVKDYF